LIAARLDTLAPDRKALLQDAAVLGKVFWTGALCIMGERRPDDVEAALHELSRKEFIRAARTSSMEGEREHGFWHMLVRDVAYGQIPRGARASKHVAAAEWIEERAGDRVEDLADVLAHHYVEALDLTSAAGGDVVDTTERAISFLGLAARRSAGLDPTRSAALHERALSLMPEGHPDRPSLQHRLGEVMKALITFDDALECFERASNGYRELGNEVAAADAQVSAIEARAYATASAIDRVRLAEVISVLEAAPPGPELVRAYSTWTRWDYTEGSPGDGVGWADKTLATGAALGLADDASALQVRGAVRFLAGDAAGLTDLRRSESLARERGDARGVGVVHNSIALVLTVSEGPGAALKELDVGIDRLRSAGHEALADSLGSSTRLEILYDLGRWEEIMQIAEAGLAATSSTRHPMKEMAMRFVLGHVLMWRGDPARAASVTDGLLAMALDYRETDTLLPTLDVLAHIAIGAGEPERCRELLHEIEAHPTIRECWNYLAYLPEIVRLALAVGDMDLARRLGASIPPATLDLHRIASEMVAAQLAEAGGDHDEAAKRYGAAERGWRTFSVPELAQALLGRGRCLVALNDPDAESTFRDARDVFASLDARRYLPEVDGLLERAMRQTS
jgi:tetratricopeptide (TPR) repeat protein